MERRCEAASASSIAQMARAKSHNAATPRSSARWNRCSGGTTLPHTAGAKRAATPIDLRMSHCRAPLGSVLVHPMIAS